MATAVASVAAAAADAARAAAASKTADLRGQAALMAAVL
jgi:hypothetical protein